MTFRGAPSSPGSLWVNHWVIGRLWENHWGKHSRKKNLIMLLGASPPPNSHHPHLQPPVPSGLKIFPESTSRDKNRLFFSLLNRLSNAHPQDKKQFGPQAGQNALKLLQTAFLQRSIRGETNQCSPIKSIVTHLTLTVFFFFNPLL